MSVTPKRPIIFVDDLKSFPMVDSAPIEILGKFEVREDLMGPDGKPVRKLSEKYFERKDREAELKFKKLKEDAIKEMTEQCTPEEFKEVMRGMKLVEKIGDNGKRFVQWVVKDPIEIVRGDLLNVLTNKANQKRDKAVMAALNLKKRNSALFAIERL